MKNIVGTGLRILGISLGVIGAPSAICSVISSSNPTISREFAKALLAPVTISKSQFGTRLNLAVGGRYEQPGEKVSEELVVNFEDNNIDRDSETLIFSRGQVIEMDTSKPLPDFLVDESRAQTESYCTLKLNRAAVERWNANTEGVWTLKEGSTFRINPYTPAPLRSQQLANRVQLNLELVARQSNENSDAESPVEAEGLRCEVFVPMGVELETGLVPELERVLSTWIRFKVNESQDP